MSQAKFLDLQVLFEKAFWTLSMIAQQAFKKKCNKPGITDSVIYEIELIRTQFFFVLFFKLFSLNENNCLAESRNDSF